MARRSAQQAIAEGAGPTRGERVSSGFIVKDAQVFPLRGWLQAELNGRAMDNEIRFNRTQAGSISRKLGEVRQHDQNTS
jgi:hypothetical protein